MVRLSLYARVSSDKQREAQTIESQLEALRGYVAGEGMQIDERQVHIDDGYSGFYFDRPGLDHLRDAARDGLIDLLLVHDPDRLARRYAYQVLLLEELERFGVEVRFLHQPPPDSPDQKLLVQIQGAIAEYERAKILERTRRGRLFWARQGRPVSNQVPFGYRYLRRQGQEDSSIEVDEAAVEVIRQIFSWYTEQLLSYRRIAMQLTARGTPTPRGRSKHWDPSTVRWILHNQTYLGTWFLNRYRREVRPGGAGWRTVERPREEWIPITVPRVIETEVFLRAQEIGEGGGPPGRSGPYPLTYPEAFLLRRLVMCGVCKRKMTSLYSNSGHGHMYYWCRGPDPHRVLKKVNRCPHPTVLTPQLDQLVWSDLVGLLTDPEMLLQAWKEQQGSGVGYRNEVPLEQEQRRLGQQRANLERQRQRIVLAYQEGAIELEELVQRRNRIEEKLEGTKRQMQLLKTEQGERRQLTDLNQNLGSVCSALENGLEKMERKDQIALCQKLIERVVVENGVAEIHYRFPVSSNCNRGGEAARIFLQGQIVPQLCRPPHGRYSRLPRRRAASRGRLPPVGAHVPLDLALPPGRRPQALQRIDLRLPAHALRLATPPRTGARYPRWPDRGGHLRAEIRGCSKSSSPYPQPRARWALRSGGRGSAHLRALARSHHRAG